MFETNNYNNHSSYAIFFAFEKKWSEENNSPSALADRYKAINQRKLDRPKKRLKIVSEKPLQEQVADIASKYRTAKSLLDECIQRVAEMAVEDDNFNINRTSRLSAELNEQVDKYLLKLKTTSYQTVNRL